MEPITLALGSNLGDKQKNLAGAAQFLESISEKPLIKSSLWRSEPVGPSRYEFLNCTAKIHSSLPPEKLLKKLKDFEQKAGREKNPERWAPRILDIDIVRYGNLVIQTESLIIPHQEYRRRLFVLLPMQETDPGWQDPVTGVSIQQLIKKAPSLQIEKTDYTW